MDDEDKDEEEGDLDEEGEVAGEVVVEDAGERVGLSTGDIALVVAATDAGGVDVEVDVEGLPVGDNGGDIVLLVCG